MRQCGRMTTRGRLRIVRDDGSEAAIWGRLSPAMRDLLRADPAAGLPVEAVADLARPGGITAAAWWIGDKNEPGALRLPRGFQDYVRSLERPNGEVNR